MAIEKLIVIRNKRFSEPKYSVGIYVDDKFIVNTLENNRQEIELEAGKHTLKVVQGIRSGEIEIEIRKGKTLTCNFSGTTLTYLLYLFFIGAVAFSYIADEKYFFPYIPALLIAAYTFTLGRKSYFIFETPEEDHKWLESD